MRSRLRSVLSVLSALFLAFIITTTTTASAAHLTASIDTSTGGASLAVDGVTFLTSLPGFIPTAVSTKPSSSSSACTTGPGADVLGAFNETVCGWVSALKDGSSVNHETRTKVYSGAAVFTHVFPDGWASIDPQSVNTVATAFPSFGVGTAETLGYLTWHGSQTCDVDSGGTQCTTCKPFTSSGLGAFPAGSDGSGPVVIFNNATGARSRGLVLASANNFMVKSIVATSSPSGLSSGLIGSLTSIPAGFRVDTIAVAGNGVNDAMRAFGDALLTRTGKPRRVAPGRDVTIDYLGYWTDNGASEYYNPLPNQTFQQTMATTVQHLRDADIPVSHLQLDSWWYIKGPHDGTVTWAPAPGVFPDGGMQGLQSDVSLPIVAHNRFWSDATTYAQDYPFVIDTGTHTAMPNSTQFWMDLMANASQWDLAVYEQDWLYNEWNQVSQAHKSPTLASKWLSDMNAGALHSGITIQYCMSFPRHIMASSELAAVTQARASSDYSPDPANPRTDQWTIGVSSILHSALGITPFKDDFWSSSNIPSFKNPKYPAGHETAAVLQAMAAVLSTGPVGFSDAPGNENKTNIMRTCRADGRVLKPDVPATALDATFPYRAFGSGVSGPDGEVWSTHVQLEGLNVAWGIVLVPNLHTAFTLTVEELVANQPALAGLKLMVYHDTPGQPTVSPFSSIVLQSTTKVQPHLIHFAPVLSNGYALLGERSKIVPVSKGRVVSVSVSAGQVSVNVVGAPSEQVTMTFVTPSNVLVDVSCPVTVTGSAVVSVVGEKGACA